MTPCRAMQPKAAFVESAESLERYLGMIAALPQRMLVGLKNSQGEFISLVGGWYLGDRAIVLVQLNDQRYTRESISLVTRSYLIESCINRNFAELVFWGGTSKQLSSYCRYPDLSWVYVDSPSVLWRMCRGGLSLVLKLVPAKGGEWLRLIGRGRGGRCSGFCGGRSPQTPAEGFWMTAWAMVTDFRNSRFRG